MDFAAVRGCRDLSVGVDLSGRQVRTNSSPKLVSRMLRWISFGERPADLIAAATFGWASITW